jgi:DNA-binding response OmpR family regulator
VLVVVGMGALRRVMTDVLEAAGFAPFECDGLECARSLAPACSPDVVIVDDHLPDGSGAELVRWLRSQRNADGRPLLVAALTTWASFAAMTSAGAHCTVWKPAVEDELIAAVRWLQDVYASRRDGNVHAEPLRTPAP